MKKNFLLSFILATFCLPIFANNITVSAPTLTDGSPSDGGSGYGYVNFDLSWENSWRLSSGASNWDAAWVFVKYRVGGTGEWLPANLHNTGHIAGSGTAADITVGLVDDNSAFDATTNPGIGVYVYRSTVGSSTFSNRGLKLRWDYGADGVVGGANVELRVFAIEMVRVMEGAFNVGGGGGNFAFESTTISTANATTAPTGVGALGGASGGYPTGITGITVPANATWPNGYAAFYCMKYEVTQQQYVDFLNTLTQTQADAHKHTDANYRYAITGSVVGNYATTLPNVACNLIYSADGIAYADWSGLRPMTELEFEKACRGNQPAVAGEYAWGTADIANNAYTLSNAGAANEGIATNYSVTVGNGNFSYTGPVRVGIFAANGSNTGRVSAGASYWGIMELSGNLAESTIFISNSGKLFTGATGDGLLASNGDSNIANCYPLDGYRGGSFGEIQVVSSRISPYNTISAFYLGFRAVRR
jgi:formylglycine-generating enzyme required for sulfatase activity